MQAKEGKLGESIKVHQKTLEELNLNAQNAVKQINAAFATSQFGKKKKERQNELLGETEAVRLQKEKELKLEKEGLEMFGEGMRSAAPLPFDLPWQGGSW